VIRARNSEFVLDGDGQDFVNEHGPLPDASPELSANFLGDYGIIVDLVWHQTICLECEKPVDWIATRKHLKKHHSKTYRAQTVARSYKPSPMTLSFSYMPRFCAWYRVATPLLCESPVSPEEFPRS
jgi:hypothetical protein